MRGKLLIGSDLEFIPPSVRDFDKVPKGYVSGLSRVVDAPSGLRLRASPSLSGEVLIGIPNGTTINTGPSPNAGWAYAEYGGYYGYASTEYLEAVGGPDFVPVPNPPAPTPEPSPAPAPAPSTYVPVPPPPLKKPMSTATKVVIGTTAAGVALLVWAKHRSLSWLF